MKKNTHSHKKTTYAFKKKKKSFFRGLEYKAILLMTKDVSNIQTNTGHTWQNRWQMLNITRSSTKHFSTLLFSLHFLCHSFTVFVVLPCRKPNRARAWPNVNLCDGKQCQNAYNLLSNCGIQLLNTACCINKTHKQCLVLHEIDTNHRVL